MVSKFGLLTNLLLASVALAAPSSQLGSRLARRRENRQSRTLKRVDGPAGAPTNTEYSDNWAGAVWNEASGMFDTVTGTFTVPTPSGSSGSGAAAWVGIDGDTCQNAILQTGVDFTMGDNGEVSYGAWYEWYPDNAGDFSNIIIDAGDVIRATVTAFSPTSGEAMIENLTTGRTVTQYLSSSSALCGQDAEWIVEDFEENGALVPLADFGTVIFSGASASGPSETFGPSGADMVDIEQNNQVDTSVSIDKSGISVTYQ